MPDWAYVDHRFESTEEFCRALHETAWRKRPALFRNPLGAALASGEDLRDGLTHAQRLAAVPRVYADRQLVEIHGPEAALHAGETPADFCRRLMHQRDCRELGYVLNGFEAASDRLWFKAIGFLRALHEVVGFPAGYSTLTLFMGFYGSTPFGFHKDIEDVLTFVVEGKKRFLVWPYSTMSGSPHVPEDALHREFALPHFDYSSLRSTAVVLEGRPGDVLYWPWDHWHIAESDGSFAATLSMGSAPFGLLLRELDQAVRRVGFLGTRDAAFRAGGNAGDDLESEIAALQHALCDGDVRSGLREQLLLRRSRSGLTTAVPPLPLRVPGDGEVVEAPMTNLLSWQVVDGTVTVAVNGHGFRSPLCRGLLALLCDVNRGAAVAVGTLRRRHCTQGNLTDRGFDEIIAHLLRFKGLRSAGANAATLEEEVSR